MRTVLFIGVITFCTALASQPAQACGWDMDTTEVEARGLPDAVNVIWGIFPREPKKFYTMRIARMIKVLRKDKNDLEAYDNLGVANDKIGNSSKAIQWMNKKKLVLDKLDTSSGTNKDHLYRYHANIGTFYIHRWIRAGANRQKMQDVDLSIEHIKKAIEINPDAHFGREIYQLNAIELIKNPHEWPRKNLNPQDMKSPAWFPTLLKNESYYHVRQGARGRYRIEEEHKKTVEAIMGMIVMGNAWESVDMYHSLSIAFAAHGDNDLAELAKLRVWELLDKGKKSIYLNAPDKDTLKVMMGADKQRLREMGWFEASKSVAGFQGEFLEATPEQQAQLRQAFQTEYSNLRKALHQALQQRYQKFLNDRINVEKLHKARHKFMMRRFAQGKHPDTHPDFYKPKPEYDPKNYGYKNNDKKSNVTIEREETEDNIFPEQ